ncbi:MAG: AAA family ATPase [Candidatus Omnitrophica bacterium]|nr:AAA family ATPase [Candidatus Omnitrophota bacterium]
MYEEYWGLKEKPFENTPNPRFLYYSPQHEEVMSRLLYIVKENKGAALLTGVFGCGKTLLGRTLLKELDQDVYRTAFITNPYLSYEELLMHIVHNLGGEPVGANKTDVLINVILEKLNEILVNNMRDGKRTVIIIDEAHVIKDKRVWEEIRLILNFQLEDRFLLTLLILGQPELKTMIDGNKEFAQRIAVKSHLANLTQEETKQYIIHRLSVAGRNESIFSDEAYQLIFAKSGGIPRRINHICDLALLSGSGEGVTVIGKEIINDVSSDLE